MFEQVRGFLASLDPEQREFYIKSIREAQANQPYQKNLLQKIQSTFSERCSNSALNFETNYQLAHLMQNEKVVYKALSNEPLKNVPPYGEAIFTKEKRIKMLTKIQKLYPAASCCLVIDVMLDHIYECYRKCITSPEMSRFLAIQSNVQSEMNKKVSQQSNKRLLDFSIGGIISLLGGLYPIARRLAPKMQLVELVHELPDPVPFQEHFEMEYQNIEESIKDLQLNKYTQGKDLVNAIRLFHDLALQELHTLGHPFGEVPQDPAKLFDQTTQFLERTLHFIKHLDQLLTLKGDSFSKQKSVDSTCEEWRPVCQNLLQKIQSIRKENEPHSVRELCNDLIQNTLKLCKQKATTITRNLSDQKNQFAGTISRAKQKEFLELSRALGLVSSGFDMSLNRIFDLGLIACFGQMLVEGRFTTSDIRKFIQLASKLICLFEGCLADSTRIFSCLQQLKLVTLKETDQEVFKVALQNCQGYKKISSVVASIRESLAYHESLAHKEMHILDQARLLRDIVLAFTVLKTSLFRDIDVKEYIKKSNIKISYEDLLRIIDDVAQEQYFHLDIIDSILRQIESLLNTRFETAPKKLKQIHQTETKKSRIERLRIADELIREEKLEKIKKQSPRSPRPLVTLSEEIDLNWNEVTETEASPIAQSEEKKFLPEIPVQKELSEQIKDKAEAIEKTIGESHAWTGASLKMLRVILHHLNEYKKLQAFSMDHFLGELDAGRRAMECAIKAVMGIYLKTENQLIFQSHDLNQLIRFLLNHADVKPNIKNTLNYYRNISNALFHANNCINYPYSASALQPFRDYIKRVLEGGKVNYDPEKQKSILNTILLFVDDLFQAVLDDSFYKGDQELAGVFDENVIDEPETENATLGVVTQLHDKNVQMQDRTVLTPRTFTAVSKDILKYIELNKIIPAKGKNNEIIRKQSRDQALNHVKINVQRLLDKHNLDAVPEFLLTRSIDAISVTHRMVKECIIAALFHHPIYYDGQHVLKSSLRFCNNPGLLHNTLLHALDDESLPRLPEKQFRWLRDAHVDFNYANPHKIEDPEMERLMSEATEIAALKNSIDTNPKGYSIVVKGGEIVNDQTLGERAKKFIESIEKQYVFPVLEFTLRLLKEAFK